MTTIEDIQQICQQLPGVTEDIKWDNHLCFCVAEKMFLILGLDQHPVTASFKVPDAHFDEISSKEGFSPAAYLARYKWVAIDNIQRVNQKKWEQYARQSYMLIVNKLPKKKRPLLTEQ